MLKGGIGWIVALCVGCAGCGTAQGLAGLTSHALRVLDNGHGATTLVETARLELPTDGELVIKPVLLRVNAPIASDGEPVRGQLVVRATRRDGGVLQWFVGADGRAPAGERGFRLASARATHGGFGGADYGPIRADSLVALEVAFAVVPEPPRRSPGFVGMAAVERFDEAAEALQDAIADDGATMLLAVRLAVTARSDLPSGHHGQRLLLVGIPHANSGPQGAPHTFDGAELRDASGAIVPDASFLVLELGVNVPEHD